MGKFIVPPPQPPPPHTNVSYRLWRLACKASTCPPLSIIVRWVRGGGGGGVWGDSGVEVVVDGGKRRWRRRQNWLQATGGIECRWMLRVVCRSKSHGVTREGRVVQPSAVVERGPVDWGVAQVSPPLLPLLPLLLLLLQPLKLPFYHLHLSSAPPAPCTRSGPPRCAGSGSPPSSGPAPPAPGA